MKQCFQTDMEFEVKIRSYSHIELKKIAVQKEAGWWVVRVDGWVYHVVNVSKNTSRNWRLARTTEMKRPSADQIVSYQYVPTVMSGFALICMHLDDGDWYPEYDDAPPYQLRAA